jgi:hypothetical protein
LEMVKRKKKEFKRGYVLRRHGTKCGSFKNKVKDLLYPVGFRHASFIEHVNFPSSLFTIQLMFSKNTLKMKRKRRQVKRSAVSLFFYGCVFFFSNIIEPTGRIHWTRAIRIKYLNNLKIKVNASARKRSPGFFSWVGTRTSQ